jgi:hypothetical protein
MSSVSEQEVQQFRSSHDRQSFLSDQEIKQEGIHFQTRNEADSFRHFRVSHSQQCMLLDTADT